MARIIRAVWLASTTLACAGMGGLLGTNDGVSDVLAEAGTVGHCVSNGDEFRAALQAAASNNHHDIIRLVQGQYNGNFGYNSSKEFNLAIQGGYTANCVSRIVDPANTIVDGRQRLHTVLSLASTQRASFTMEGLTIRNARDGGGLLASTAGEITLIKNVLKSNVNWYIGGGAYLKSVKVTLRDNTVSGNWSYSNGGGLYIEALGIELTGNRVRYNGAENGTAGILLACPDDSETCDGTLTLSGNTVEGNSVNTLGPPGIYTSGFQRIAANGNVVRSNCDGGIFLMASEIAFVNNIVADNRSEEGLAGAYLEAATIYVVNNTIVDNWGGLLGGLDVSVRGQGYAGMYNNIVYGNECFFPGCRADLHVRSDGPSTLGIFNNDFNQSGFHPSEVPQPIDPSNLDNVDPILVDPAHGNYHLQPTSPVINKGSKAAPKLPAKDIEGKPRILLGTVDMGAYEVADASSPGVPLNPSPANGAKGVALTPTLTWTGGAGATSHDVFFGPASPPHFLGTTTASGYSPGTLVSSKAYYWRIVAKNSSGTTSSPIWSFQTGGAAPAHPSPASGATGVTRTPTLSWTGGLGATSHDVYFGLTSPPPRVTNTTGSSYKPATLEAARKFYWKVVVKRSTGGATSSPIWSFTTR